MTTASVAASSASRRKLKAFQFIEGRPSGSPILHEDKENEPLLSPLKAKDTPQRPHLSQTVDSAGKTAPPSTPATRLPLADLLGNPDDTHPRFNATAITPQEDILWRHAQSPYVPISLDTPAGKRRRAKSSSPTSSQTAEADLPLGDRTFVTAAGFETPRADPTANLWNKYALKNGRDNDANPQIAFAHLIKDASPRSSATASSISGLRRWASCGVEWPTSKSKRRRTTGRIQHRPNDDEPLHDHGTRSKVSDLIERMKKTLAQPREFREDAPASSSPAFETAGITDATSPLQRLGTIQEAEDRSLLDHATKVILPAPMPSPKSDESTSDYGDIDVDLLANNDVTMALVADGSSDEATLMQERILAGPESAIVEAPHALNSEAVVLHQSTVDETFDIGEDDFGDDIEQLAQQYDSQIAPLLLYPEQKSNTNAIPIETIELSDDEFGETDDLDVEQFAAAEAVATQRFTQNPSDVGKRAIQRYLVVAVDDGSYIETDGTPQPEKILVVEDDKTRMAKRVILRQSWWDTNCNVGSYVHIIGEFSNNSECIIDNSQNMVILHPDHLISATTVADSFGCMRRAVLQDRVKATSQASPPLLYGSVLHELFQAAMSANLWDDDFLKTTIDEILPRHFETIVQVGLNLNQVHEHLYSKLPEMQGWAKVFVKAKPSADALIKSRGIKQLRMSVNKLLDVEEHVWSPMYGLKGNIDATVQVVIDDGTAKQTLTVPFEVKTGKRGSESHVAQTALYTLLLSDRYDIDVQYGILYYLEKSEMNRIHAVRHEIIHMIMKRNELACYVRERISLPPPLQRSHLCRGCYAQTTCFLYHKLSESGNGSTVSLKDKFDEMCKGLRSGDQQFFQKWDHLITKEEGEMMKFRRELWTMLSSEREKLGRCFSDLIIKPGVSTPGEEGSRINRYRYVLIKRRSPPGFSFAESHITTGEPIVISDEDGHFALANGYVISVSKKSIEVAVDRRLHNSRIRQPGFDLHDNQTFAGIMTVKCSQEVVNNGQTEILDPAITYRLDKDEFSNGMATVRNNLLQIMDDAVFKAADLRSLIINGRAPRFKTTSTARSSSEEKGMNDDQKAAIDKVMRAHDYALVLGMPGTGKTTTIAQIIRALVAKGKTVLLTSYTHTAVDNILLKVQEDDFEVLRLGVLAKIHPEVQKFATLAAQPKAAIEELSDSWHRPPVVATTCLGLSHLLFSQRTFDVCIVDEASQVTLPVCLGPLRMAKTFVLVGDHYQLPPLVQNKEAKEGGLDVSLFKLLSESQRHAVVELKHQYRMCADIMMLANELIYGGKLACGTEQVATRELHIERTNVVEKYHYGANLQPRQPGPSMTSKTACKNSGTTDCHLNVAIQPKNRVIFFNTDNLGSEALESLQGNRITNAAETIVAAQLAYLLLNAGVPATELGIMTFYRSQLALLRQSLRSQPDVELHTADKFQGRDKEAVIVSFVRNNEAGEVGELLKDWRRVNVAITRARSKLILVGSKKTLAADDKVLSGLVKICEREGWVFDLSPGTLESHFFPELLGSQIDTQASPAGNPVGLGEFGSSPKRQRKADSSSSPLKGYGVQRSSQDATASHATQRKPLESTSGNRQPTRIGGGLSRKKAPEKSGKVNVERILKARPVLNDVLNDML